MFESPTIIFIHFSSSVNEKSYNKTTNYILSALSPFATIIPIYQGVDRTRGSDQELQDMQNVKVRVEDIILKIKGSQAVNLLSRRVQQFSEIDGIILGKMPEHEMLCVREKWSELLSDYVPYFMMEDEERLRNKAIRNAFMTRCFMLAKFHAINKKKSIRALIDFQSRNKYLFMAWHQNKQKELGRLVAHLSKENRSEIYQAYGEVLSELLHKPPTVGSMINALQHIAGYFSKQLTQQEKGLFLSSLSKYQNSDIPLSHLLGQLKTWSIQFQHPYLQMQTIFEPYPKELSEWEDTEKPV